MNCWNGKCGWEGCMKCHGFEAMRWRIKNQPWSVSASVAEAFERLDRLRPEPPKLRLVPREEGEK